MYLGQGGSLECHPQLFEALSKFSGKNNFYEFLCWFAERISSEPQCRTHTWEPIRIVYHTFHVCRDVRIDSNIIIHCLPQDIYNIFTPLRVGGRPHRKFFGSVLVKICFKKLFAVFCDALWLFSFNTHVIYTFLGMTSVQILTVLFQSFLQKQHILRVLQYKVGPKHWFLQCVQYSNIPNPLKTSVFACFFSLLSVFPLPEASQVRFSVAGTPPKRPKIPSQYPLQIQRPKIVRKITKTPAEEGFRCEIFKGPPPPS